LSVSDRSTLSSPSQVGHADDGSITRMRLCISAHSSFGVVVTMVKLRTSSSAGVNSDIFDRLPFPKDFDRAAVVLPTRLSDETETGGLFGFRFE
jgi:hypothetical protein